MRVLLTAVFLFWSAITLSAQPKLEVGKVYAVVLSCGFQYLPTEDGYRKVTDCYTEYWRILSKPSKDGWVKFEDAERKVIWWGNINRVLAMTEAEQKQAEPEKTKA